MKTVVISKFIWQRVPDCRASVIQSPTDSRTYKSAARNSETIQVSGSYRRRRRGAAPEHLEAALRWLLISFIFPTLPRSLPRTNLLEIWYRGRHADVINCVAKLGPILQSLAFRFCDCWNLAYLVSPLIDLGCRVLHDSARLWYRL